MSSTSSRQPEFRLQFGYPKITLRELGRPEPVAEVELDDPAIAARLRGLGATVAGGRLVAVLPEAEVWRGTLALEARGASARRVEARARIAAALGLPAESLAATVGPADASGRSPAAAVRRSTLAEARTFLGQARLRAAAIVGDGAFPGFEAAPRLDEPGWGERARIMAPASAALAATACLALAFTLSQRPAPAPEVSPVLSGIPAAAPLPAPVRLAAAEPVAPVAAPKPLQVARPAPVRLAHVDPAPPRPALPTVVVSEGTRNMPELAGLKLGDDLSPARVAGRIAAAPRPVLRPADAPAPTSAASDGLDLRPVLRPAAVSAAEAPKAVVADPDRPVARPDGVAKTGKGAEPVRVASLTGTATDASVLAASTLAASAPPEPRPDAPVRVRAAAKPKVVHAKPVRAPANQAARAVPAQPKQAEPAPQQVARAVAPAPLALPVAQPSALRAVQPAPQQVVRVVAPAPQITPVATIQRVAVQPVAVQPVAVQPVQTAMVRSTGTNAGLQRGSYALLGVFGTSDGRHALVRLPSGTVRRVHVGDNLQGAEVAAVAADSVRLTGGGRDLVLKLE